MIEINGNHHSLCFIDTCVISEAFEKKEVYRALLLFLVKNKCFVCLSINTFFELENRPDYFEKLLNDFRLFPTVMVVTTLQLRKLEIDSYPHELRDFKKLVSLNLTKDMDKLSAVLSDKTIQGHHTKTREDKKEVLEHILSLRENFPPKNKKSYSKNEAQEFVNEVIYQQLIKFNPIFYSSIKNPNEINLNVFKSFNSQLFLTFWKFYKLKDRKPRLSDIYDLSMSSIFPYMDFVLSENNIVSDIRQIKNISSVFRNVSPLSIKDILTQN